jgi:hypothetical protein
VPYFVIGVGPVPSKRLTLASPTGGSKKCYLAWAKMFIAHENIFVVGWNHFRIVSEWNFALSEWNMHHQYYQIKWKQKKGGHRGWDTPVLTRRTDVSMGNWQRGSVNSRFPVRAAPASEIVRIHFKDYCSQRHGASASAARLKASLKVAFYCCGWCILCPAQGGG